MCFIRVIWNTLVARLKSGYLVMMQCHCLETSNKSITSTGLCCYLFAVHRGRLILKSAKFTELVILERLTRKLHATTEKHRVLNKANRNPNPDFDPNPDIREHS